MKPDFFTGQQKIKPNYFKTEPNYLFKFQFSLNFAKYPRPLTYSYRNELISSIYYLLEYFCLHT